MKLRFVAMTGVLSLAGLGLIGAGAHAAWTTNTTSNQQVSSGVLSVGLTSSVGGTCAKYDAFGSCQILTLPTVTVNTSTFTTGPETITLTNNGTVNVTELDYTLSSTPTDSALAQEAWVCFGSTGIGTGGSWFPIYSGPLSGLATAGNVTGVPGAWGQEGDFLTPAGTTPNLSSGPTDNVVLYIYAGNETTPCGPTTALSLNNDAMGESLTLSGAMTYNPV